MRAGRVLLAVAMSSLLFLLGALACLWAMNKMYPRIHSRKVTKIVTIMK